MINNIKLPLYVYWLIGFGFYLLGSIYWFFYILAIIVWISIVIQAIKK